jgi:ABC-2 type transport system permease protein
MSAAPFEELRLLPHVIAYEWRKATAFRVGFILRELLRGLGRPVVMTLVFIAMFHATPNARVRGYRLLDLIGYLIWTAVLGKCLCDERSLDVAEQIFDGYITKYFVMPVSYFTLIWGRFLQFSASQLLAAVLFWVLGALLLPSLWPFPVSGIALLQASVLLLLGACCYLLAHFILNCMAFWLDVTWSLQGMFRFVALFVSGALIPVSLMPAWVESAFSWLFPYWTLFAPAEILLGRQGTSQFLRGATVLSASLLALQWLAASVFRRGRMQFAGSGT